MDTLKDTTMQHVTDVTIAEIKRAAEHPAKAPVIVRADTMLGVIERIEQFESDLATAEQDSRQKQARIDRLEAAAPDLLEALREIMPFTATAAIGCHGDKCREPWCYSCNGEEEAEEAAQKGCDAYAKARAVIAKATGEQA